MRLGPMTIFMFVMYLMIGIFDQTLDPSLNAYGNAGGDFLFNTIIQPWNWSGTVTFPILGPVSSFILILGSAISVAVGIAVLGSILGRSDISVLFALFTAFAALGAVPCIVLYNFVSRNVALFTNCQLGEPCGPAMIFGALTAGILAVMWLFTCVEWWAWRATTQ
jgi:ABC-type maltose transport system permease subunit